jgi:hypothetical protein
VGEDIKFEGRLWAIVGTGQRQYIGQVEGPGQYVLKEGGIEDEATKSSYESCPPYIELYPCYELLSMTQMARLPDGTVMPMRDVRVMPVDQCLRPVRKRFRPVEITWAEDIHDNDRDNYTRHIRQLRMQMEEERLAESGAGRPPPDFDPTKLPRGNFGKGGPPFGRS